MVVKKRKGRQSKYNTHVLPNLKMIEEWINSGILEGDIAEALGVNQTTFSKYKREHPLLARTLENGRKIAVTKLDNALFKKAVGYEFEETKIYITEENGKKKTHKEVYKKVAHPDVAAINLLKKNWCKGSWSNDPELAEIRRAELELKEKMAEQNIWVD